MNINKTLDKPNAKKRIWEIDFIRGFCILLMLFDHLMCILGYMYTPTWLEYFPNNQTILGVQDFALSYFTGDLRTFFEPLFASTFIFLCGLSCVFSRSNLKRGLEILFFALLISIVSYKVTQNFSSENYFIHFGILHFLSFSILFWELVYRILNKNKKLMFYTLLMLTIIVFVLNNVIENSTTIPPAIGGIVHDKWRFATHFSSNGDYFAIIPNLGIFLIGSIVGLTVYYNKKTIMPILDKNWHNPVCFVGRHALFIYATHQIFFNLILILISYFWLSPKNWVIF